MRHRPLGIGIQGLADTFVLMRMPFASVEAKKLNIAIAETMYFAALTTSKNLAMVEGPYESYPGSPISQGILQFDMWGVTPTDRWDWASLRKEIATHGIRNSLLIAPMPTASTSQILGNNPCIEPYTSNLQVRRTLAGEFVCVNQYLVRDLMDLGLWSKALKEEIIIQGGSVQNIDAIPEAKIWWTWLQIEQRLSASLNRLMCT
ncbi:unnamed protein product [Rotaria magnacalcarata]|uniref:Ribonucleotide reductase large subunit domain-containing protein n=1 Tax=Rotaria magnacalcarata TaxID=392030 RepID=A0A8S2KN44_9BILA|nr:unnamed protein product [Rotaria magnacalcarata]